MMEANRRYQARETAISGSGPRRNLDQIRGGQPRGTKKTPRQKRGRRSGPPSIDQKDRPKPKPNEPDQPLGLGAPVRANMLHTAKPDPVISADMHHHTKSLYEATDHANLKVHTVRSARSTAMIKRGPVARSALFRCGFPVSATVALSHRRITLCSRLYRPG